MNFKYLPQRFLNKLYSLNFSIYKPLYFFYKNISDKQKIDLIKSTIKPGMICLDIGANVGFYSLLFSKLVGKSGKVHAFEPDSINFKHLSQTTRHCSNLKLNQLAVSSSNQPLNLYLSDQLNVDHQTFDIGQKRKSKSVKATAIDSYLKNRKVNFIKIDIQGFDHQALKEAKKTLKQSSPLTIIGEFWPFGLKKAGTSAKEYLKFLKNTGFKIKFLPSFDLRTLSQKEQDQYFYCDFIATKK